MSHEKNRRWCVRKPGWRHAGSGWSRGGSDRWFSARWLGRVAVRRRGGRKTYDIFAAHWPFVSHDASASNFDALNADIARRFDSLTKYVATHRPESLTWKNSQSLGTDVVARLRQLKQEDGPVLLTQGSTELLQLLLQHDLIDELRLTTFPVVLGEGKKLFGSGALAARFKLTKSMTSPNGAVIANYARAGDVETANFGMEPPTAAELERRRNLT